ncbi:MAG: glycosyltransferase, partial [Candidatus Omnitrophica bacterium]|nr:glycosyltransferase [Candidatus Omnitrophota bacterium]
FNTLALEEGSYLLKVNMLKEGSFWFDDLGIPSVVVPFEVEKRNNKYGARITLSSQWVMRNIILKVFGTVENTGIKPWDNRCESRETAFHVGGRIYKDGAIQDPVGEMRFYLDGKFIPPGSRIDFNFEFNTLALEEGSYLLKVNMLKEGSFWFDDLGIPSVVVPFEVEKRRPPDARNIHYCRTSRSVKILCLAPTLPKYDQESGGNRLFEILRILRKKDYDVTFLCEAISRADKRYLKAVKKMGIKTYSNPMRFLSRLKGEEYNVCIFCWPDTAIKYLNLVREILPHTKTIVDSVDVHWVRETRGKDTGALEITYKQLQQHKRQEIRVYQQADAVWAVTENDREEILKEIPDCKVKIVSNIHRRHSRYIEVPNGNGVIFVGNFNHPPNESAAVWGYEICNAFREKTGEGLVYYIIGYNPPSGIRKLHDGKHTIVTGYVKNLSRYYRRARAFLAPLKYGAGIKGKICHAICSGLPVLTTPAGNEGINLQHNKEALIATTTDEFVDNLIRVFSGEIDLTEMNERALRKILALTNEADNAKIIDASLWCKPIVLSIISYNKKHLLRRCIDSILEKTIYPNYKIAVVCNGCTDGSKEMMSEYVVRYKGLIDFYYNQNNEFFVRANNFIIEKYKQYDVVLINNDIEVLSPMWLMSLYNVAYISNKVGAAGGKILDVYGYLSEAGAELYNDGRGRNIGRGESPDKPEYNRQRYVGYVSGCLLYMRRDMIERFGALDDDFHPMYYEDSAWQYRLHSHGIYTVYTPSCVAVHNEGSSAGVDIHSGMKKYQEINRVKFLAKFKEANVESLNPWV